MEIRNYGKIKEVVEIQNLVLIQTKAYRDFLQSDISASKRKTLNRGYLERDISNKQL